MEAEKIHWNQLFCGMYDLAVMLSITRQTNSKNIDEINVVIQLPSVKYKSNIILFSGQIADVNGIL